MRRGAIERQNLLSSSGELPPVIESQQPKRMALSLSFRLFYPSFLLLVLMDALANGNNFPIFSWARACLRSSTTSKVAPTHLLFLELVVSSETRPKCVNKQEGRGEYIQVVNIFTYPRSCSTAFELCTSNECASHCRRMGTRASCNLRYYYRWPHLYVYAN